MITFEVLTTLVIGALVCGFVIGMFTMASINVMKENS